MNKDIIDKLVALGLSSVEAQVYLTLLKESPLTGYAVAQQSNVSRTRIYDILEALVRKGFVTVGYSKTAIYSAIPYNICLSSYIAKNQDARRTVLELLHDYDEFRNDRSEIISIYGNDAIYSKLRESIVQSRERIVMKLWAYDLQQVKASVEDAYSNGIELHLIVMGDMSNADFPYYCYKNMSLCPEKERSICCSFDNRKIMYGTILEKSKSYVTLTENVCFRMFVNANLIEELRIARLYQNDYDKLSQRYGEDLTKLREKYNYN